MEDLHAGIMRPKGVLLYARELSDLYALMPFYRYLAQEMSGDIPQSHLFFGGNLNTPRSREILGSTPTEEQVRASVPQLSIGITVGTYSDINGWGDLQIDTSLLKNSVIPLTAEEKRALRERYDVPLDERVLVIGFASPTSDITRIAEAASQYAHVYVVGLGDFSGLALRLSEQARSKVHFVTQYGILKDYFAMADAAISGDNLSFSRNPLHNFVEATEGGPLFLVPSRNTAQYGYRQLVQAGAIVPCRNLDEIITKVTEYLAGFDGNTRVADARAAHLRLSRETYLPVILAHVRKRLGQEVEIPESDLVVEYVNANMRLMHPDTCWRPPIYIPDFPGALAYSNEDIIPTVPLHLLSTRLGEGIKLINLTDTSQSIIPTGLKNYTPTNEIL